MANIQAQDMGVTTMDEPKTFGEAARHARIRVGLSLRDAAGRLRNPDTEEPISPSYLSKIELDRCEPPSADLILQMSRLYRVPWEKLGRFAKVRVPNVIGEEVQQKEELLRLYRFAKDLPEPQLRLLIDELIEKLPENSRSESRRKLNSEFPRENRRNPLFAPQVQPRRLSKIQIRSAAERVLARSGLTRDTYVPPTPIETLIEAAPNIRLHPSDDLAHVRRSDGSPIVLGVTKWCPGYERVKLIEVDENLYESENRVDRFRLNFTLAHEFWHALEHLELARQQAVSRVELRRVAIVETTAPIRGATVSEDPSRWWASDQGPRVLKTPEDWQEWQANWFAAEVLAPEWDVKKEFERLVSGQVVVVAPGRNVREVADQIAGCQVAPISGRGRNCALHELYAVSRQAIAIRLLDLKLVRGTTDVERGLPMT